MDCIPGCLLVSFTFELICFLLEDESELKVLFEATPKVIDYALLIWDVLPGIRLWNLMLY